MCKELLGASGDTVKTPALQYCQCWALGRRWKPKSKGGEWDTILQKTDEEGFLEEETLRGGWVSVTTVGHGASSINPEVSPFYRREIWWSPMLSHLVKVTICGRAGPQTQRAVIRITLTRLSEHPIINEHPIKVSSLPLFLYCISLECLAQQEMVNKRARKKWAGGV